MRPYYDDGQVTIYHGDVRDVLPALAPVDLVLTDPPYPDLKGGYERGPGGVGKKHVASVSIGDVWEIRPDEWMPLCMTMAQKGLAIFCSHHSVVEIGAFVPADRRVALLTWYKRNAAPTGANVPRFTSEFVWLFRKQPGLKWDAFDSTVLDVPNINAGVMATERVVDANMRAVHPTQKPVALMRRLLQLGGSTVLDPFMGTGTTVRAAKDMGCRAIGIEIEERYCELAVKRLQQAVLPLGVAS